MIIGYFGPCAQTDVLECFVTVAILTLETWPRDHRELRCRVGSQESQGHRAWGEQLERMATGRFGPTAFHRRGLESGGRQHRWACPPSAGAKQLEDSVAAVGSGDQWCPAPQTHNTHMVLLSGT